MTLTKPRASSRDDGRATDGLGRLGRRVRRAERAVASSPAAGLPFAGVPPELADRVEEILETEPEHTKPHVHFTQIDEREAPFTLRRFLATRKAAMAGAFALVLVETLAMQAGPLLTQSAIDKGILAKSTEVLVVTAVIYALSVVVSMIASSWRASRGRARSASRCSTTCGSACSRTSNGSRSTSSPARRPAES